ncbi:MAG: extracellular solute-binding protein, partial [Candidatus Riflebacteria bacterium]|nr:extracellular solute-binding protein [Candidatus Riflebacteria bacterium]
FVGTATPVIDQKLNIEALQYMCELLNKQPISPPNTFTDMKEEEVRMFFHNGNALFERNWPYAWGLHNAADSAVRGKVGIAPLPGFAPGKSASTLGGWHIVMSRFSDKKPEAAALIKYLTSTAVQKQLSLNLGWNPGRIDVYDDPELLAANPALKDLKQVFHNAVPRPIIPYYSNVSQILQKHISAALANRSTPEESLKRAQTEVLELMKSYGIK